MFSKPQSQINTIPLKPLLKFPLTQTQMLRWLWAYSADLTIMGTLEGIHHRNKQHSKMGIIWFNTKTLFLMTLINSSHLLLLKGCLTQECNLKMLRGCKLPELKQRKQGLKLKHLRNNNKIRIIIRKKAKKRRNLRNQKKKLGMTIEFYQN